VAGNKARIYHSELLTPAENEALNRGIQRIATDPKAITYVDVWHRSRGDFVTPLVTVHNQIDSLVPYSQAATLADTVARAGNSAHLLQLTAPPKISPLTGIGLSGYAHCGFTTAQKEHVWDLLHGWVQTGVRPAGPVLPPS
jgi:hypothetical protein